MAQKAEITLVDGVKLPTSPAIVAENAKTGDAWWVTTVTPDRSIEGFADRVSAVAGDRVTLFVNTVAARAITSRPTGWATTRASGAAWCGHRR